MVLLSDMTEDELDTFLDGVLDSFDNDCQHFFLKGVCVNCGKIILKLKNS